MMKAALKIGKTGFETEAEELLASFQEDSEVRVCRFLRFSDSDRSAILSTLVAMLAGALAGHPASVWPREVALNTLVESARFVLEGVYFKNATVIQNYFELSPELRGCIVQAIPQVCYRQALKHSH
jgi:hypothetical protein